jgi:ABC-type phosphate transport system substrate-binding protein
MARSGCLSTLMLLLGGLLLYPAPARAQYMVVIVNRHSQVQALTPYQVIDIFMGRFRQLPGGGTSLPIDIAGDSPERRMFYKLLIGKTPAEIGSYWARLVFSGQAGPPFQAPDPQTALDLVAHNPNAIAYVDKSLADRRVRVVLELKH